jgi:VanZ family protein
LKKKIISILRYQFPAFFWAALIYLASSIPAKYLPSPKIFHFDKIVHIILFFILGILIYRALEPINKTAKINHAILFFSLAVVIFYGIMDEMHQGSVPGRTVEVYDALADTIGGLLAGVVIYIRRRKLIKT